MQTILQNRYQIKQMLGQGGMGTVYIAQDMRLGGKGVVVKQLRDDFYRDEDRQRAVSFFEREIDMLIMLEHPNIVEIKDRFIENGKYFLVMEHIEGEDFHSMMQRREGTPYGESEVISWAIQICDVLQYLHGQNPPVIYRDLKPSNIMLDSKGQLKVVDFGIARPLEDNSENTHVVSAGYSPPEQYWGGATIQSDIYALGTTMYYMLTGKDPEPLKPASPKALNPEVSDYLDELVQKATAQQMEERFANADEMKEALLHHGFEDAPENVQSWFKRSVAAVIFVLGIALVFGWEPLMSALTSSPQAPVGTPKSMPTPQNPDPTFGGAVPQRGFALQVTDEKQLSVKEK